MTDTELQFYIESKVMKFMQDGAGSVGYAVRAMLVEVVREVDGWYKQTGVMNNDSTI